MTPKSDSDTSRFLKQWHEGDQGGLDALVGAHLSWVRVHVRKRLGPLLRRKAETNDIVQDAMVQFLRYGPSVLVSDSRHFRALIVKIVENSLRNKYDWFTARRRAISRENPLPPDTVLHLDPPHDSVDRPSQLAQRHEHEAWVRLGLELIDLEGSEIIILRQWDNLSYAAIGERLGISAEAARARYGRAVMRLAEEVGKLRRNGIVNVV